MTLVPIVNSKGRELSYEVFLKELRRSASSAYRNRMIFCSCILIFDTGNPEVVKLLRDQEYYQSLDQIAGKLINVYHASVTIGPGDASIYQNHREEPYRDIIQKLRSDFIHNVSESAPLVMVFYVVEDVIPEVCVYRLSNGSPRELYEEIRLLLEELNHSLSDVDFENAINYETIFDLQRIGVDSAKRTKTRKEVDKIADP